MRICVIGAGYVGLVAGACLAKLENKVVVVEKDPEKLQKLHQGKIPIYEPGLDTIVNQARKQENISFTAELAVGLEHAELVFIAVGTPPLEDGSADLSRVQQVAAEIREFLIAHPPTRKSIIFKSTVPIGATRRLKEDYFSEFLGDTALFKQIAVLNNPEFLREGCAIQDFLVPDRVVIGAEHREAAQELVHLYQSFCAQIVVTSWENAELIKYTSNAFLATKISFINEIAGICSAVGGDIQKVAEGIGLDRRIGPLFLRAGVGYGGSCLPKDMSALIAIGQNLGVNLELLSAVERVNIKQQENLANKVWNLSPEKAPKRVGAWGLAFKPETDDIRESPALGVLQKLSAQGCAVQAYDPIAMENTQQLYPQFHYCCDPYAAATDVDVLLILTEWPEFAQIDLQKLGQLMAQKTIIDGRNLLDPQTVRDAGFDYASIGR